MVTLDLVGLEGLSSHLEEATNELYEDREGWEMWKGFKGFFG